VLQSDAHIDNARHADGGIVQGEIPAKLTSGHIFVLVYTQAVWQSNRKEGVMGTMEGFFLGQMLAPISNGEHNEAEKAWRDRAKREMARAESARKDAEKAKHQLEAAEKLAEKEHKRFLLERRERIGYMKGWALRGKVLTENCGYSIDRVDAECDVLEEKYREKLKAIALEDNAKIDQEAGFQS
jgi:hypothetical protein